MSTPAAQIQTVPPPPGALPPQRLLIFAGGGSGGHIFPGLAIAAEVQRLCAPGPSPEMLFVTSDRGIDAQIMAPLDFPHVASPARPMILKPMGLIRFVQGWEAAVQQATDILTNSRPPQYASRHVVAMGGFVAAPFVRAAANARVPVTMVNLDAVPGKANKYIARHADRIFTTARVSPQHRGRKDRWWIEVPPIVRKIAGWNRLRDACRIHLGIDPTRPVLMITGGSQGLRSLNEFVTAFAASEAGQRTLKAGQWQVLHQTGRNLDEAARTAYKNAGIDATVVPFNEHMGDWWGASDLAVCTAGAGNIAEIWQNKTPALLLPYPHHKDEHQKFNAAPLSDCAGAVVCKDWIDPALNLQHNAAELESLLSDPDRRAAMRANLEKLGPADGATRIARALLDIT